MQTSKLGIAVFLVYLLMVVCVLPVLAVEYIPGVSAGQGISYNVYTDPPTEDIWMLIEVVTVSGREVTLRTSGQFENGTVTPGSGSTAIYNVESGTMNGVPSIYGPIIAANLNEGDPLSTEPPGSDMKVNKTETRTYLGVGRSVNILDTTASTADYTNRWTIIYDKTSGIMLEMEMETTQNAPTPTTTKTSISLYATNIFATPTSSPPITSPTPSPTPTPTLTPTPTGPTLPPTIGPPSSVPTPAPTSTPKSTPTPQPGQVIPFEWIAVIIAIVLAIVVATLLAKRRK